MNQYIIINIKTKINSYNTNFYRNKREIEGEHYTHFSLILLDSINNVDKKYHPQIFLKECKYTIKKQKIMDTINEELKLNESDDAKYDDEYDYPFKC